jgi:beta-glucosidase
MNRVHWLAALPWAGSLVAAACSSSHSSPNITSSGFETSGSQSSGTQSGGGTGSLAGGSAGAGSVASSGGTGSLAGSSGAGGVTSSGGTGSPAGSSGTGSGGVQTSSGAGLEGGAPTTVDGGPMVVSWPSAACQDSILTSTYLSKMKPLQKAEQMVMAPAPVATGLVTMDAPGAIVSGGSGGGGMGPPSQDPNTWVSFTAGYYAAAKKAPLSIPILYGVDIVHGANASPQAVIMPHNTGLGATRDFSLIHDVYNVAAQEALALGINWAYGPFTGVVWDYRWGRVYESFGGDPTFVAPMVQAAVLGFQGPNGLGSGTPGMGGEIACSKHFAGDGQMGPPSATGGVVDRGVITVDQADMFTWGINPYIPAIQAGLGCIMVSDATWNGKSLTEDTEMITTILKGQLGFKGFVCTDWDAGNTAVNVLAGDDMMMHPDSWQADIETIANMYAANSARIDDAVLRILRVKCQAGVSSFTAGDPSTVGSPAHRAVARKAVGESMVVLQNTGNVLPLAKTDKVYVTGSGADSMKNQCGGWTVSWQGDGELVVGGTTIQAAVSRVAPAAQSMADADVVIVVLSELSEHPYAETPGDSATLDTLPAADFTLLSQARASGKKVVAIIVSGRPVLINSPSHPSALTDADAWIAAWLPGSEGDGVADVLFGDVHPVGKLPHMWPANDSQARWGGQSLSTYTPLFKIGDGLTW